MPSSKRRRSEDKTLVGYPPGDPSEDYQLYERKVVDPPREEGGLMWDGNPLLALDDRDGENERMIREDHWARMRAAGLATEEIVDVAEFRMGKHNTPMFYTLLSGLEDGQNFAGVWLPYSELIEPDARGLVVRCLVRTIGDMAHELNRVTKYVRKGVREARGVRLRRNDLFAEDAAGAHYLGVEIKRLRREVARLRGDGNGADTARGKASGSGRQVTREPEASGSGSQGTDVPEASGERTQGTDVPEASGSGGQGATQQEG
ncbi:hypothetical protein P7C70_g9012, partial [Phenoliferia sp. Uapishka_3]